MPRILFAALPALLASALAAAQQTPDPALLEHLQQDQRLFDESPQRTPTLEDRVLKSASSLHLVEFACRYIPPEFKPERLGTRAAAESFLAQMLQGSDVVLVGSLAEQVSALSEDKHSVFTEAGFRVDAVLAQKQGGQVQAGERVYVAREGGRLLLAGHALSLDLADFPALRVGQTYLLFLHKAEHSDSYQVSAEEVFWCHDGALESIFHPHPVPAYWKGWDRFVQIVRDRGTALE